MQVCAINSGYWDTKAYNGKQMIKFRTKMDIAKDNIVNADNTFRVSFENQEYIIGEGAEKFSLSYDKTLDVLHKLATYYSICKLTEGTADVNIMVALPLNYYAALKQQYSDYLKTRDYISFTVDGSKKYFKVLKCEVFPEGPAALYSNHPERYKNDIIGILDIGSLTINGCVMNNLNMVKESIFTINSGTIILYNKLRKELNNRFLLNLRDYEIPGIIKNGLNINGQRKEIQEIINNVIGEHLQEVILEMRRNNWPVESIRILCTGGGSLLLDEYLKKTFSSIIIGQDPVFDNVKGLYNIAGVVFK